ncbi:hypothetical protein LTR66_007518, partial [Elasticomyces elasticus]
PPPLQRPYSPYRNTHSPVNGGLVALPPAKRQRLSPHPLSPTSHTSSTSHNSPGLYPYPYPHSASAAASPVSFNQPSPAQSSALVNSMPPPPRPGPDRQKDDLDKHVDVNDISDLVYASGIDLREEENYLANSYRNIQEPSQPSFSASFNSSSSLTLSPHGPYDLLTCGNFGSHPAFSGSGPVSQQPLSQKSIDELTYDKHRAAARQKAEHDQQHLRNPFLLTNVLRIRMHKIAEKQGVRLNVEGLFDKAPGPNGPYAADSSASAGTHSSKGTLGPITQQPHPNLQHLIAIGPGGTGLVETRPEANSALLLENSLMAEMLGVLSLASNERIRNLLDESFALARGRRFGSHGVVPPEWAVIAVAENGAEPQPAMALSQSITDTAWDKPATNGDLPTAPPTPASTIEFPSTLPATLRAFALRDREAESARLKKRRERRAMANTANPSDPNISSSADANTANSIDGTANSLGPESQIGKPLSKKERDRQAKIGMTEEVLHKAANQTAALALGGSKKKKYAWMESAGPAVPTRTASVASSRTTASQQPPNGRDLMQANGIAEKPAPVVDRGLQAEEARWGEWTENGALGRGIQIRDWVNVLSRDGRERKVLIAAMLALD